MKKNENLGEAV